MAQMTNVNRARNSISHKVLETVDVYLSPPGFNRSRWLISLTSFPPPMCNQIIKLLVKIPFNTMPDHVIPASQFRDLAQQKVQVLQ